MVSLKQTASSVFATLLTASGVQAAEKTSPDLIIAGAIDGHFKKGDSDHGGDYKAAELTYHDSSGWMISARSSMDTPQFAKDGQSYDTSSFEMLAGKEHDNLSLYGGIAAYNGLIMDQWHSVVDATHVASGITESRKSDATTKSMVLTPVIKGRYDESVSLASSFSAHAVGFGTLSAYEQKAGAGGYLTLSTEPDNKWKPNLPGFPSQARNHSGFYAGVTGEIVNKDIRTDKLGTNPMQTAVHVGGQLDLGSVVPFIDYTQPLSNEIKNPARDAQPVSQIKAGVNISF